jgi:hypothetical protein
MNSPSTILALASKQIWPHVLALVHCKPQRLVLLHSEEKDESQEPAQRLREFLARNSELDVAADPLEKIAHDNFNAVRQRLDSIFTEKEFEPETTALNFTGGNKLMAAAAFEWAKEREVPAFYLERNNKLVWFRFKDGQTLAESPISLDPAATNGLDAIELLKCQLGAGVLQSSGQSLRLSEKAKNIPLREITTQLRKDTHVAHGGFDFRKWLEIEPAESVGKAREGDNLEYGVAVMLLRIGPQEVYRGVELRPHIYSQRTEGELDLVFNWNGRLWVVDCKDKASGKQKLEWLKTALVKQDVNLAAIQRPLEKLEDELKEKDIKVLREDLLQISEVGGLLGNALAVRREALPQHVLEFAQNRRPRVEVILKDELEERLRALLCPKG